MAALGGSLERAVMDVLWGARQALRIRELLSILNHSADRPLAYNTVQTVAERLARKGYLDKLPDGPAFRYRPTRTREDHVVKLMLDALTESTDHGAMLARFADSMADEDARRLLDALRRRAAGQDGD